MARKAKIGLQRFSQRTKILRSNYKKLRQHILIICEGEKTEPNYFKSIENKLPRGIVKLDIYGEGKNTLSLVSDVIDKVEEVKNHAKRDDYIRPYDQAWVVFDRDSFNPDQFDNAISKAKANDIKVAYSNEAFELWYILHFEYLNAGITRNQYKGKLTYHLGAKYEKNSEDMYKKLKDLGDQDAATKNAIKLLELHNNIAPSLQNPSTRVHELVIILNEYINGD